MRPQPEPVSLQLKTLSREGIPAALERAERYRFLNEPSEAESICLDVLSVDPENRDALITLLLALSDQFSDDHHCVSRAHDLLSRIPDEYQSAYYAGLLRERQARACLRRNSPGAGQLAYTYFVEAMGFYEKAETIRPAGNDDALLRWNSCVRAIDDHQLKPEPEDDFHPLLE